MHIETKGNSMLKHHFHQLTPYARVISLGLSGKEMLRILAKEHQVTIGDVPATLVEKGTDSRGNLVDFYSEPNTAYNLSVVPALWLTEGKQFPSRADARAFAMEKKFKQPPREIGLLIRFLPDIKLVSYGLKQLVVMHEPIRHPDGTQNFLGIGSHHRKPGWLSAFGAEDHLVFAPHTGLVYLS